MTDSTPQRRLALTVALYAFSLALFIGVGYLVFAPVFSDGSTGTLACRPYRNLATTPNDRHTWYLQVDSATKEDALCLAGKLHQAKYGGETFLFFRTTVAYRLRQAAWIVTYPPGSTDTAGRVKDSNGNWCRIAEGSAAER